MGWKLARYPFSLSCYLRSVVSLLPAKMSGLYSLGQDINVLK